MNRASWFLFDVDLRDHRCSGCGHPAVRHRIVVPSGEVMTFPCTVEERWVVGPNGKQELTQGDCPCEDYIQEGD